MGGFGELTQAVDIFNVPGRSLTTNDVTSENNGNSCECAVRPNLPAAAVQHHMRLLAGFHIRAPARSVWLPNDVLVMSLGCRRNTGSPRQSRLTLWNGRSGFRAYAAWTSSCRGVERLFAARLRRLLSGF